MNQQILEGNWNEIKGKIQQKWGQLTDDDLQQSRGNAEQVIGSIERKTGEGRQAIEQYLEEVSRQSGAAVGAAAETARSLAEEAANRARAGYKKAKGFIHERPAEAVGAAFVLGLIAGAALTLTRRFQ